MTNRALLHARFAGQHDIVCAEAQRGSQRTHGGARITQEQFQLAGSLQRAAVSGHFAAGTIGRQGVVNSQRFQRVQHVANIIAVQQVCQDGGATRQRRQQQRTVRHALRTRQINRAVYARDRL